MKKKSRLFFALVFVLIVSVVILTAMIGRFFVRQAVYPLKYEDIVDEYSEKYGVEKALVYAVIKAESNFDKDAVSVKSAYGLMQITEDTMHWLSTKTDIEEDKSLNVDKLFDEEVNIRLGILLLRLNLEHFENDYELTLCAYNAGRTRVDNWRKDSRYSEDGVTLKNIPYRETREYVQKVLKYKSVYNKLYFS